MRLLRAPGTPPGRGWARLGFLLLALFAAGPAFAGTTVLLPPGVEADARTQARVEDTLGGPADLVAATDVLARVDVVTLRARDPECEAPVDLAGWRARLGAAEAGILRLSLAPALSSFVGLELELTCLRTVATSPDLFRLELGLARAHDLLARAAERGDPDRRLLHEHERDGALARAASWGAGLTPPADLAAELRGLLDVARPAASVTWVVAGPAAADTRVDGRADVVGKVAPGPHLVQVAVGSEVVAADLVSAGQGDNAGSVVVWAAPGFPGWTSGEVRDRWAGLGLRDDPERDALLAAIVLASGTPALLWGDGEVYEVAGGSLRRVDDVERPRVVVPVPRTSAPWRLGAALGGGWSTVHGGPLDGLSGPTVGGSVWGGRALGAWTGVLVASLYATPSRVPVAQGGGVLFRGGVPVRVGLWWEPGSAAARFSGGAELGVHVFGAYTEGYLAAPVAGVTAGVSSRGVRLRTFALGGLTPTRLDGGPYALFGLEVGAGVALAAGPSQGVR